ncbi:MAG: DUF1295 domain-containing protein [Lepagella sp.]
MFDRAIYDTVIAVMLLLAVVVFFALQYITAGYGMMYNKKWGFTLNNRLGWVLMEAPSFVAMLLFWLLSDRAAQTSLIVMALLYELHYFQRSFIFPMLIRGKGRMPISIIAMGVLFNLVNVYMIGGWLFYVSPADSYPTEWLYSPQFIVGTLIFFLGMLINLQSDYIIRHLRRPGDTRHYIPKGGMYRYVTSANYFGELTEWIGYAILTWSLGGVAFVVWTFANLAPRAKSIHSRYISEFGDQYRSLNRKYILPYIY